MKMARMWASMAIVRSSLVTAPDGGTAGEPNGIGS